jgi:DNA repair protein RadC
MTVFKAKPNGKYVARRQFSADDVLNFAMEIVGQRFQRGACMSSPEATRQFLTLQLAGKEHEVFGALFLDSQHRLIQGEELFRGTIDSTSVHPRVVVQRALQLNAASLILYHNHPSGVAEPSAADRYITERLVQSLGLIDVPIIDHFVVAGTKLVSFAERGWL